MGSSSTVNFGITTLTTTADVAAPKTGLLHSIVNVVVSVSGADVCDPESASVPDSPPRPMHVKAFFESQVSSAVAFDTTRVGSASMYAPGGRHAPTVTLAVATPP